MSPLEMLGVASALMALFAFILNEYHILRDEDFLYDFLNLLSGAGLFYYASTIHAIPFMLTNAVWALVSLVDVVKYLYRKAF